MQAQRSHIIASLLLALLLLSACNRNQANDPTTDTAVPATATTATETTVTNAAAMTETAPLTTAAPISAANAVTASAAMTATVPATTTATVTSAATITATEAVSASVSTTATTAGQWGTLLDVQFIETVAAAEIGTLSAGFYPPDNLVDAQYAVDIYRLTLQTSTELGEPIAGQADLFVPRVEAETQFPVFGYAPGTTGLGDGCVPSQEYTLGRQWGSYRTHMLSYAAQGFIGVLPDGMSYNDPERPHEYFIAELEAHMLLDASRAAYRFLAEPPAEVKARPLDALFFAGYSNGGHTAFAAKDFATDYAPELPLRGVISHGATTNVETLLRESPIFTPYLIYAYRHFFGAEVISPEQVFLDDWLPTFDQDALTKCVDDIFVYYSSDPQGMYRPEFRAALLDGRLADQYPLFKAVLDANYAGTFGGFDIPIAFFQGTGDYVVTPASQASFATLLCEQAQPVTYVSLPTVEHVNTRQASFKATIAWMQGITNGQTPQSNCAQIAGD